MADSEVNDKIPAGDCVEDGGSDWRNDAGEDGGAIKGSTVVVVEETFSVPEAAVPGTVGSGTRVA